MPLPASRRPSRTPPGRRPAPNRPDAPPNPFFIFITKRRNTIIIAALNLLVFAFALIDRYGPLSTTKEKVQRVNTYQYEFMTDQSEFPIANEHYYVSNEFIGKDLDVQRTMSGTVLKYSLSGETNATVHEPFHHRYSYIELQYLNGVIAILLLALRKLKTEVAMFANTMGIVLFMGSVFVLLFN